MNALVSSESAHVTVMPVVPSGKVKRRAEAIVVIVSNSESKGGENTHKSHQESYHSSSSGNQLLSTVNLNRKTMSEYAQYNLY
jgi:hypothetical protein